jgi:hypothetical protein
LPQGLAQEAQQLPVEFQDPGLPVEKTEGPVKVIREEKALVYNSEEVPVALRREIAGVYERLIHFL